MDNTVKELSDAVRRYAAEQGEEYDLRKNADLVHFGMWLLSQNIGKPIVSGSLPLSDTDKGFRDGWAACLDAHGLEE